MLPWRHWHGHGHWLGHGCTITYRQRLSGLGRIDAGDVGWRGCGVDGHDSGGDGRGRSKETCDKWTWPWVAGGFTAASTLGDSLGQQARSQNLRIRLVLSGPTESSLSQCPPACAALAKYLPLLTYCTSSPTPGPVAACSAQSQAMPCSTLLESVSAVCGFACLSVSPCDIA